MSTLNLDNHKVKACEFLKIIGPNAAWLNERWCKYNFQLRGVDGGTW